MAKVKAVRGPKRNSFDGKAYGTEPDLTKGCTRVQLAQAYNWYNYFFDASKAHEFLLDFMKNSVEYNKSDIKAIEKIKSESFPNYIGWNARILMLGGMLPDGYKKRMDEVITQLISSADDNKEKSTDNVNVISIQERVREKIRVAVADIENELDKLYVDPDYEFSMSEYISTRSIKPNIANAIAEYYIPLFNELIDAIDDDGPKDLKEGYRSRDRDNLITELKFVQAIIDDCQKSAVNQKKARMPRAKKVQSVEKTVSKLKFKLTDDKYNITSIRPLDIIGSEQLWTFNVKTRLLGVYKSNGPSGLSVKGSKIIGYDENESCLKKLRKPEDTLKSLGIAGKVQLRKFMDNINSKPKTVNGRINTDTVLVKVVK